MTKVLNVSGMSCDHCKKAVIKALEAIDGVNKVTVDLQTGKVTVECSTNIASRILADAVVNAGYAVI